MNEKFIYVDEEDDGTKVYIAACSMHPRYEEFYRYFVPNSSYRCIREDFPRDAFVFDDPDDEAEFLIQFADNISL